MQTFKRLAALILLTASLSFCLVPSAAAADSKADMQRAIVETAIAYYLNGADQQYDSTPLSEGYSRDDGGNLRHAHYFSPEDATPDQTTYSVCSEYCFEVIYNALGYKLLGDPRRSVTLRLQDETKPPLLVYQFDNRKVSEAEADAAAEKAWNMLQPGDVVVDCTFESTSDGGHAMLFVGDIDGDGVPDILHSAGKKYDMSTGLDAIEPSGTVKLASAEQYFHTKGKGRYFGQRGKYSILRVVDDPDQPCAITLSARTRMKYPWMRIVRTVDKGCYGAAEVGGQLTYNTVIYNRGKEDFKAIPVTDFVPKGTELVQAPGAQINGDKLSWTVDVPAGQQTSLSMTVKVTSPLGTEIVSEGGKVGEIPMKVLATIVGGSRSGLQSLKAYTTFGPKLTTERSLAGTAFGNAVYRYGMGVEIGLPDASTLFSTLFRDAEIPGRKLYTLRDDYRASDLGKMVVRHWVGGRSYHAKDTKERVQETRLQDLQCGDLIFVMRLPVRDLTTKAYYFDGNNLIAFKKGTLAKENPVQIEMLLSKTLFLALRPTQAYENLKERAVAEERFSDVKRSDWFYSYVSDLAADGMINGVTATTFVPNGTLTYGQALKLIALAVGEAEPANSGAHWASGYLTLAKSKGWLLEDADPDETITRLAFCRIAAQAKGLREKPRFNPFTDTDDAAVLALYQAGVINGITSSTFQPEGKLTRAQIAKIIHTLRGVIVPKENV